MADRLSKLEKAYRQNPESPLFARLADQYLSRGMVFRALDICEEGCERFPDYTTGFLILSRCYEARDDFEAARKAMGRALRLDPENPGGFKRLSNIYQNLGNSELALKSLEQAARLDPLDEQANEQVEQFTHYAWADSMEEAAETFDELPEESPEEARETTEYSPSVETETLEDLRAEVDVEIDQGQPESSSPALPIGNEEVPFSESEEEPDLDAEEESFIDDATETEYEYEEATSEDEEELDLELEEEPDEEEPGLELEEEPEPEGETTLEEIGEEEPAPESDEVSFISEYSEEFAQESEEEVDIEDEEEREEEEEDREAEAELEEEPVPDTIEELSIEIEEPPTEEIAEEPASVEEESFIEPEPESALDTLGTIEELSIEVEEQTPEEVTEKPVSIEEEEEEEALSGEIADLGAIAGFMDEQEDIAPSPDETEEVPSEGVSSTIAEDKKDLSSEEEDLSSLGAEVFDEPSPTPEPIEAAPAAPPPLEQTEEGESVSDFSMEVVEETVETVEEEEEGSDLQEIAATLETERRETEAEIESSVPPSRKGGVSNVSGLGPRDDDELLRMFQEIEAEQTKELGEEAAPPSSQVPSVAANDSPEEEDADRQIATVTLAEIYTIQGLTQRAIDTYEQILEQDPGNEIIRNKLADLKKSIK